MRYLAALRSGVKVEQVADKFAQELVEASMTAGELCMQCTCNFINDTLLAIGFACEITPDVLHLGEFIFPWPKNQLRLYIFQCNELEFTQVELFLANLCRSMASISSECYDGIMAAGNSDVRDIETPVEFLMEMIAIWCSVYKHLLIAGECGTANMFEEPLSRINLNLFIGTHEIRVSFRHIFPLLDNICSRLFKSAVRGLRYPKAYEKIFRKLLKIVSEYFYLFPDDVKLFLHDALIVKTNSQTFLKVFPELCTMLENNNDERLNILTNIVIEPEIMNLCYNFLLMKTGLRINRQQQEVLKYLNVLQSKLLAFDCFSRKFMESILNLVVRTNPTTASLASKLYLDILKKKLPQEGILSHILNFYATYVVDTSYLKRYITNLYNHFEYIHDVYNLLDIITWDEVTQSMRLLCAHVVITIFKIKLDTEESSADNELESILLILPQILEKQSCQLTIGILLQLFDFASFDSLQKQITDNLIHYVIAVFSDLGNEFEYPLLTNIFTIFHKFLSVVNEWQHLELIGNNLILEYRNMIKSFERMRKLDPKTSFKGYYAKQCNILKRLNIIIKTRYDVFDYLPSLISLLEEHVLSVYSIGFIGPCELCSKKTFADIYALEIVMSCIIKLSKEETTESIFTSLAYKKAQELSTHLVEFIKNKEEFLKLPEFRMKAYFCSLLNCFCHLPLKISTATYFHMVHILIFLNLNGISGDGRNAAIEESQHANSIQRMEYIRIMFHHFTELHKYSHVEIRTNNVWKLCLYFGQIVGNMFFIHANRKAREIILSSINKRMTIDDGRVSKFDTEIMGLLITLADKRFSIYKHIMAVIVYNLYKQHPPINSSIITLILKRHIHLIDYNLPIDLPNLLKVHIVLLVLQITEKGLGVQRIRDSSNRLVVLRDLHMFLVGERPDMPEAKQLILQHANSLKAHLLTGRELQALNTFIQKVQF